MVAVDTNVVVRLLTGDDARQTALAKSLFEAGPIWIAQTVWLETDWVLRSLYKFEEKAVRDAFVKLLGLENVHAEDQPALVAALALTVHGIGFADALHLCSRPSGATFLSFDQPFVRRARRAGVAEVSQPSDYRVT